MMNENLQVAELSQLEMVWDIFTRAVAQMNNTGINQWDELYPDEAILLEDIQKQQLYIFSVDGRPAACVVLNEEQSEEYQEVQWQYTNGRIAVIHRVCVDPRLQNRGIAKKLLAQVEEMFKQQGYTSVRLDAFSQNPYSNRLYQGTGYVVRGEIFFRKGMFYC
jgi:ribosomal protein S18 acetylase RimI-like enzyme